MLKLVCLKLTDSKDKTILVCRTKLLLPDETLGKPNNHTQTHVCFHTFLCHALELSIRILKIYHSENSQLI